MSIKQITSFYDFEKWLEGKQQHVDELEHENIELTRENMKLKREIDNLKKSQVEYINQILKKSPAATEDSLDKYLNSSIPEIFKGREQECQKK